jgi:superkiller protein 3
MPHSENATAAVGKKSVQFQHFHGGSGIAESAMISGTPRPIRGQAYSEAGKTMRIRSMLVALLATVALGIAVPAFADRRTDAKAQVEFGWEVALKGLWSEATHRWEKAVELDPAYSAAWNDLGIAYEQQGKFDLARKAYEKALQLDPNNNFIRQNYDLFREIYDRQNRRRDR